MNLSGLLALCLGFFMVIMDATIVNVALPSIASSFDANISWLQWIIDAYVLSFACLLLLAGHLCDRLGAKKLFLYAVAAFISTSFLCGIANSALLLTIFRLIQGAAGAFMVPTSLALINHSYPDNKTRAKALGIWGAVAGIAAATGPILGALLTNYLSWRAVFMVNIPIGLVCLGLCLQRVTETFKAQDHDYDGCGQILAMLCIASVAFGLIKAGETTWTTPVVLASFGIFGFSLIAFIIIERRTQTPMLPLHFFKSPIFSSVIILGLLKNLGFYGELFILPLYFHQVLHYNVLLIGFVLFPLMAAVGLSSYFSGKVVAAIGPKWPIIIGMLLSACGFLILDFISSNTTSYSAFILPFILMGSGTAFAMPAATIAIMHSVAQKNVGIAAATFNMSRQIGTLLGVAIFGTIIAASSSFILGMQLTLLIAIITSISAAMLVLVFH